jgi:hypothetical protein
MIKRNKVGGFGEKFGYIEFNELLNNLGFPTLRAPVQQFFKKKISLEDEIKLNEIYQQRLNNSQELQNILNQRIEESKNNVVPRSGESITFEIKNEEVTGATIKYYEFDIFVSSNVSTTYLDNAAFVLKFN